MIVDLGRPLEAVCMNAAAYSRDGGEEGYIYAVSSGKPCKLFVLRVKDGSCLFSGELEGSGHTWGVTVTPDGTVYMGGDGLLYRWKHGDTEVEKLGAPIEGETYFWRLASDEEGRVYGGTYPNGKVFRYDPDSGSFTDYGQVVEGEQYTRSLTAARKGGRDKIYAGIGTLQAHLVELDVLTGEERRIELPEPYSEERIVYDLTVAGGRLYARVTPTSDILIYDLLSEQWTDRIEAVSGLDVSPPDEVGRVYLVKDKTLCRYDPVTRELTATDLAIGELSRSFGWFSLHMPDFPGKSLVSVKNDGSFWIYNPESRRHRWIATDLIGPSVQIQSLTKGPEGSIYAGGYFAGGLARFEPKEGRLTSFKGIGQIEGMTAHQGMLYAGVYPKARIYRYDPSQAWTNGSNPALLFSLQGEQQDRPFSMVSAGEELAIGTVPDYGQLGGALTLYSPQTGETETFRNVVERQSVISLAYREGLIYGGTSVWGGLGGSPAEKEAKLFIWEKQSRHKVWEGVPVPGERAVSSIVCDSRGKLWGLTAGKLFRFDLKERTVETVKELFPFDWSGVGHYWRGGFLRVSPEGLLYGCTLNRLFEYDSAADRLTVLAEPASLFAEDDEGNFYFSRREQLLQFQRSRS